MRFKVALLVLAGFFAGTLALPRVARGGDSAAEEVKQHFFKGQQFFDVGRWDDAAEEFEKAYSLKGDPTFIYNMGQAYRRKGDAKRALDLYKNYLIKAPRSPQRAEVEERIRGLQKQLEEAEYQVKPVTQIPVAPSATSPATSPAAAPPAPAPVVPAPAPNPAPAPAPAPIPSSTAPAPVQGQATYAPAAAPSAPVNGYPPAAYQPQPSYVRAEATPPALATATPGHGLRVTGVVLGITGVALVGAGIFCGAEAASYSHSVETGSVFNPSFQDRGKLYETLQWVGYGVGAGLVATGAALYGIGVVAGKAPAVALAPSVFPGGAGLGAQGVF